MKLVKLIITMMACLSMSACVVYPANGYYSQSAVVIRSGPVMSTPYYAPVMSTPYYSPLYNMPYATPHRHYYGGHRRY